MQIASEKALDQAPGVTVDTANGRLLKRETDLRGADDFENSESSVDSPTQEQSALGEWYDTGDEM